MLNVQIKVLDDRLFSAMPSYATPGSAGLDLRAMIDDAITIKPNETIVINTGMNFYLANPDYAAMILPRSGISVKHGIVLGNLVGLIDSDYQGALMVPLWNRSTAPFVLKPLERIAQLIIVPVMKANFQIVSQFSATQRGEGGFGSTGMI